LYTYWYADSHIPEKRKKINFEETWNNNYTQLLNTVTDPETNADFVL
jgi:hypothetical protein